MPSEFADRQIARMRFLKESAFGFGGIALTSLLSECGGGVPLWHQAQASDAPLAVTSAPLPHFAPRVSRVIFLFMHGGPSHVDLFDPKPELHRYEGQTLPTSFGPVMTRRKVADNPLLGPIRRFRRYGESGLEISDFLPHLARCADDLCVIRSCHGDSVNHPQSVYQMNTGSILMGKPSLGSWVAYGLGSENRNMPSFVVMPDPGGGIKGGPPAWGSGFLPATFQGTAVRPGSHPVLHLNPPEGMTADRQRNMLNFIQSLNQDHLRTRGSDTELQARIESYELAFRMQTAAPEIVNFSEETAETQSLYGVDHPETSEFGVRCLLARRLLERGVRFVQLYCGDTVGWDAHDSVEKNHSVMCRRSDLPVAGLLTDLKRRGLWDDTLVIWGGEFGRMPMSEQRSGRDHNPWGFSVVLSGGAVRGGLAWGQTDDVGLRAAVNPVHIHDLHATILHLLGLDHERLTWFHNGREERLTDVAGRVVHEVLS